MIIIPLQILESSRDVSSYQIRIMALLAKGFNAAQVAVELKSTHRKIQGQIKIARKKTGSKTAAQLIAYAFGNGLIKMEA